MKKDIIVKVGKFWSNSYIEYERNGDRNKTVSMKEYLNKSRPYLKDIINNINDEVSVMHSKSDYIEIMINDKVDEVIHKVNELNFFSHFFLGIKLDWKRQLEVVISYLIVLIYYVINVMK